MRPILSLAWGQARISAIASALLTAGFAVAATTLALRPSSAAAAPPSSYPIAAVTNYKALPLYFEENRGQFDSRVLFLSRGYGHSIFLTGDGNVLTLSKRAAAAGKRESRSQSAPALTSASVWMNLEGARSGAKIEGIDILAGKVNYFIGNNPAK
jgi:hypothetical protein